MGLRSGSCADARPRCYGCDVTQPPKTDDEIARSRVDGIEPRTGPIVLVDSDDAWPGLYALEAQRVREALGDRVLGLEHVGSTSVPGLAAKPRIDVLLVVRDSSDEPSYVPPLQARGYVLRVREPEWYAHRVLCPSDTAANVHVFAAGCPEIERMVRFRDWLRAHEEDRALYERTKRALAARSWKFVQNYADAKSEVVEEILARALASEARRERP